MNEWPARTNEPPEEVYVYNEDEDMVISGFNSYGAARAWIEDTHDHQENSGLPLSAYSVIPVRSTPGGVDRR